MVMGQGEHGLYADPHFGIHSEKEVQRTGTLSGYTCVVTCTGMWFTCTCTCIQVVNDQYNDM